MVKTILEYLATVFVVFFTVAAGWLLVMVIVFLVEELVYAPEPISGVGLAIMLLLNAYLAVAYSSLSVFGISLLWKKYKG